MNDFTGNPALPDLIARARQDAAMVRDYGRTDAWGLSDTQLGAALGYTGPNGRNTIARLASGASAPETTRLLLMALLDGWRPR